MNKAVFFESRADVKKLYVFLQIDAQVLDLARADCSFVGHNVFYPSLAGRLYHIEGCTIPNVRRLTGHSRVRESCRAGGHSDATHERYGAQLVLVTGVVSSSIGPKIECGATLTLVDNLHILAPALITPISSVGGKT